MNEIEKIARRLVRKCVSEVDGNFWFDRTKAAAIIKEVLAAAIKRAEEAEAKLAQSTNYVADDEIYPHVVWFANGRSVRIASGGHLDVDFEYPPQRSEA